MYGESSELTIDIYEVCTLIIGDAAALIKADALLRQMIYSSVDIIGRDTYMPAGTASHEVHYLGKSTADKIRLLGGITLKVKHRTQCFCRLTCLFLILTVDAYMTKFKSQHLPDGSLTYRCDLVPLFTFYQLLFDHPGTAACEDLVKTHVIREVIRIDTAGRHPAQVFVWSCKCLELG